MANWCIGVLKVRGKIKDVESFLKNEIKETWWEGVRCFKGTPIIEEGDGEICISPSEKLKGTLYLNDSRRCHFTSTIEIYHDEVDKETVKSFSLGDLECAWCVDTRCLIRHSKKYNLDFKIYGYERGMEYNFDFEVHSGKVIKSEEIEFEDYIWECTNPNIGG